MARRNIVRMTDEEYEALRRKQNLKKVKASMKARLKRNPSWWSNALRATGDVHVDPSSMIDVIEYFSDESLRKLTTTRRIRDIMKVFEDEGVVEKRSEWSGYEGDRRGILSGRRDPIVTGIIDANKEKFDNNGSHIPVVNVWGGSDATIYVNKLLSIAEYGENYNGWFSLKGSESTAIPYINKTGRKLADIIVNARTKHTDEEIMERVKGFSDGKGHDGAEGLADLIEIMVLSIYDPVYRDWTKGTSDNYDSAMRAIKNILIW